MKRDSEALRTRIFLAAVLVGLVVLSGCGLGSEEGPADEESGAAEIVEEAEEIATKASATGEGEEALTAREAFPIAQTAGADWAADAVFVEMVTFRESAECDGRAGRWVVTFESAEMEQQLRVHVVRGGEILQTMEEDFEGAQVITGEWIDSPEAMEVADMQVEDKPTEGCWLALFSRDGATRWRIQYRYDEGPSTRVDVDAVTGAVIETSQY